MMDTKVGKEMADEGWSPDFPVVCIPGTKSLMKRTTDSTGFASSALYAKIGHKGWEGKRIWLDINNLLGGTVWLPPVASS